MAHKEFDLSYTYFTPEKLPLNLTEATFDFDKFIFGK